MALASSLQVSFRMMIGCLQGAVFRISRKYVETEERITLCASRVLPSEQAKVTSTKSWRKIFLNIVSCYNVMTIKLTCRTWRSLKVEATLRLKSFQRRLYFWDAPIPHNRDFSENDIGVQICCAAQCEFCTFDAGVSSDWATLGCQSTDLSFTEWRDQLFSLVCTALGFQDKGRKDHFGLWQPRQKARTCEFTVCLFFCFLLCKADMQKAV